MAVAVMFLIPGFYASLDTDVDLSPLPITITDPVDILLPMDFHIWLLFNSDASF